MRIPVAAAAAGASLGALLLVSLGVPARLASMVSGVAAEPRLDGRIQPGEYPFEWSDAASGLRFAWEVRGDRLAGAISTPDSGWVAVGFGGEGPLMYGADILIGMVDGRGAHLRDHFASTPTNHEPDTALGGRNDVSAGAGLETAQGTTIEFERPLAARDSADQPLESGQTRVMLASSESDDFTAYHVGGRKAVALLDLFDGPVAARGPSLLPDHLADVQIFLAAWAALLLVLGVHGLAAIWMERRAGAGRENVELMAAALLAEVGSVLVFAAAVMLAGPIWLVGSSLAAALIALALLIALYARAFVAFEPVRRERDDGIPW
jgi:hypothetical protein